MIIGIPKEIKVRENRVGCVPSGVKLLTRAGHKVLVESHAGFGIGATNHDYAMAGAQIVDRAQDIWDDADMIIKVKEPIQQEYVYFKPNLLLFTYLHLAAAQELAHALMRAKVTSVAYETIALKDNTLPLLKPMSEVAGRLSIQVGARCLEKTVGGKGLLLGGVPGVERAHVVILGGGVVGINAAKMAIGLGAKVTVLDVSADRLGYLDDLFGNRIHTLMSHEGNIAEAVKKADLLVGAVLVTGAKAPVLVTDEMVKTMEPGSAIVDVSIDQGGAIETIKPTTHDQPTYITHDVVHYGVTNMPGCVPKTSTIALTNVTIKYALDLANKGLRKAMQESVPLQKGLNTYGGAIVHPAVAEAVGVTCENSHLF